jgi:hypothetical protein
MVAQNYKIVVRGLPHSAWAARFEEVEILPLSGDQFLLRVVISDPPALHGLLDRIRAVGLELISVKYFPLDKEESNER